MDLQKTGRSISSLRKEHGWTQKDLAERVGYAREVKIWRKAKDEWPGHVGDVSTVIRVGITGRRNTPDLYQIMQVMGPERVRERLRIAAEKLG